MKRQLILGLTVFLLTGLFVDGLMAQRRVRRFPKPRPKAKQAAAIGIRVGNDFDNEQLFAGGHFVLPLGIFWKFAPGAEYYFTENDSSRYQFNGDFLFKPTRNGMFYFGGGVAMQLLNSKELNEQIDFGGNLIVGLDFGRIRGPVMYPYIEARWTFIEEDQYFSVLGGINLILK